MGYPFKILAFFVLSNILSISTAIRAIEPECGSCSKPPVIPVVPLPPVTEPKLPVPPVIVPPVTVPKLPVPPVIVPPVVTVPKLPVPPVTVVVPPVTVPVVGVVPLPPVSIPNLPLPPVVTTTPKKGKPCAPPAHEKATTCPINTLKLGACANVLGGTSSISLGDPAVNKCCPIISGLADAEAAACLCTTLKIKTLNLKVYVPVALQILVTCGKTPPPGYTCAV